MRSFSVKLFKNIILIYLCALICFIYMSMMDAIPEHVYMEEPCPCHVKFRLKWLHVRIIASTHRKILEVVPMRACLQEKRRMGMKRLQLVSIR